MTTEVEKALTSFFAAQNLGVSVIPGAGGVYPDHEQFLLVACALCTHIAGPEGEGGLYDAELRIGVATPMLAELDENNHRTLLAAVRGKINTENAEEISEALDGAASCALSGWYLKDISDQHGDGYWRTTLIYTIGLTVV